MIILALVQNIVTLMQLIALPDVSVTDEEALEGFKLLSRLEGIIPALRVQSRYCIFANPGKRIRAR